MTLPYIHDWSYIDFGLIKPIMDAALAEVGLPPTITRVRLADPTFKVVGLRPRTPGPDATHHRAFLLALVAIYGPDAPALCTACYLTNRGWDRKIRSCCTTGVALTLHDHQGAP